MWEFGREWLKTARRSAGALLYLSLLIFSAKLKYCFWVLLGALLNPVLAVRIGVVFKLLLALLRGCLLAIIIPPILNSALRRTRPRSAKDAPAIKRIGVYAGQVGYSRPSQRWKANNQKVNFLSLSGLLNAARAVSSSCCLVSSIYITPPCCISCACAACCCTRSIASISPALSGTLPSGTRLRYSTAFGIIFAFMRLSSVAV